MVSDKQALDRWVAEATEDSPPLPSTYMPVYQTSAVVAPEGTILSHKTMAHLRPSIMRLGLLPRRTADYNYPDLDNQPEGVFGYVKHFGESGWWGGEDHDEWMMDVSGMTLVPDHVLSGYLDDNGRLTGSWVVTERVPPERLTLIKKGNFRAAQQKRARWHTNREWV